MAWNVVLALLVTAGAVGIAVLTYRVFPMTGSADSTRIDAKDLATLSLQSTQYLQGLTTAVFGLAAYALSQKWLGRARLRDDRNRRRLVVVGFLALALSLSAGFAYIEVLVAAAYNRIVEEKFSSMVYLRITQAVLLLAGVLCIGGALLWDLLKGSGEVSDG